MVPVRLSAWVSHWYLGLGSSAEVLTGPYSLTLSQSPLLPPHTSARSLQPFKWSFRDLPRSPWHLLVFLLCIQPISRSGSFSFQNVSPPHLIPPLCQSEPPSFLHWTLEQRLSWTPLLLLGGLSTDDCRRLASCSTGPACRRGLAVPSRVGFLPPPSPPHVVVPLPHRGR